MKVILISDIHSNYDAIKEAEKRIRDIPYDEIWCLGDVVGYGAEPNECVEWVKNHCKHVLMGNHDYAVCKMEERFLFNEYAKKAIEWTVENLNLENKKFIENFKISLKVKDVFLVHSSPSEPLKWEYIFSADEALYNFNFFEEKVCFIGHTHIPVIFEFKEPKLKVIYPEYQMGKFAFKLDPDSRYIINPGSIGQPRDGDPRLSFLLFDTEYDVVEFFRFDYPFEKAAEKIFRNNLPSFLGERLFVGR